MLKAKRFAHAMIDGAHTIAHDGKAMVLLMLRNPRAAEAKILEKLHI